MRRLEDRFDGLKINHIARKYNEEADQLAKIASGRTTVPVNVFSRDLTKPSVDFKNPASTEEPEAMDTDFETSSTDEAEVMEINEAPLLRDWRTQYLDWMIRGILPSDRAQAQRLASRAKSFVPIDDELYKRSPSGVLQRCIPIPEGKELIRDIHAATCGHHAAPRTLVGNAFTGPPQTPTPPTSCEPARVASSTLERRSS